MEKLFLFFVLRIFMYSKKNIVRYKYTFVARHTFSRSTHCDTFSSNLNNKYSTQYTTTIEFPVFLL